MLVCRIMLKPAYSVPPFAAMQSNVPPSAAAVQIVGARLTIRRRNAIATAGWGAWQEDQWRQEDWDEWRAHWWQRDGWQQSWWRDHWHEQRLHQPEDEGMTAAMEERNASWAPCLLSDLNAPSPL